MTAKERRPAGAAGDNSAVRIHLLGGFGVTVGEGRSVPHQWRLRRAKTAVKLLALAPGQGMHREALTSLLWPERDAGSSGNNDLHQVLYVVRRALGGATGVSPAVRDDVVHLSEVGRVWVDVDAFEDLCRRAQATRRSSDFNAALELYRGDLLPEDRFESWAEAPREALRERHLGLLVEYADVLGGLGDHSSAVDVLLKVTAARPWHEGAHRALMSALALAGRRYDALAVFDRLRRTLREEFEADPDPQTRRLYRDLLTEHDRPDPASPARTSAVTGPAAGHLPAQATSFVGRRREIAELQQLIGRTRLLTLTGPGGAGKTRLALAVAASREADYPDGVHLVEFASLSRAELAPQAVASSLGVPLSGRGAGEVALASQVGGRRLMLVLDNCEHLVESCARLAGELLRSCPGVVLIATSREPLRVGGEVVWRTPSLALPDLRRDTSPEQLVGLESVQLFLARARDVAPDVVLDSSTALAVAEICFRLDGMPLALELAAARTASLGPAQIAARLGDALALLDRGSRYAVDRQRTLAATLTWSHELLDGSERLLFRRLAVFAGGRSLEAVEEVCAGDGLDIGAVVDILARLVDKSLVHTDRVGSAVRYRLLETVRQFAAERLREAGEEAAYTRRHRDWYTALAEASDPETAIGVVNEAPRALNEEHDNLRAALATGLVDDPTTALRLAVSLWRFWLARSHFAEGSRWLESALARSPDRTPLRARALFAAAALEVRRGDPVGRVLQHSDEALEIMREVGDPVAVAIALHQAAAFSLGGMGGLARAVRLAEGAQSLARDVGTVPVDASSTHLLGIIALCRGRGQEAASHFRQTLSLLTRVPPDLPPFFAVVAPCWSLEVDARGEHRILFEETSLLFRRVGRDQAEAYTTSNLAYAIGLEGHRVEPRDLVQDSLDTFHRLGDLHGETLALCHLANIDRRLGDLAGADALLERALDIRSTIGDQRGIGVVVSNQALVAAAAGDVQKADRLLRTATVLFEETDDSPGTRGTRHNLGMVLLDAGDHSGAREVLSRSWSDRPDILIYERAMAWALVALSRLARDHGDDRAAARHLCEARRRFSAVGDVHGLEHLSDS